MLFQPGKILPPQNQPTQVYCFCFHKQELLLTATEPPQLPMLDFPSGLDKLSLPRQLGYLDGFPCYVAVWGDQPLPEQWKPYPLRQLFQRIDDALFQLAGRALHLMHWDQTHRFCGQCGSPTRNCEDLIAKTCPQCGQMIFPRISPAIIVAIVNRDQILLAHANRFPADFHSIIAGFVEPGETLEDCLRREVREEVGIEVCNIRYFGSQPWPYPDSLMIGFTAEYAGGDLAIDGAEITAAGWFRPDNLPRIPDQSSIARRMIDWFVASHREPHGDS